MAKLPQADVDGIACVMLPFQTANNFGDLILSNRCDDWRVGSDASMDDILRSGKIPFVLFSSAVVRPNKRVLPELSAKYLNNDYLQVILYLEMLDAEMRVRFITNCIIDYQPEYQSRYSVVSVADSMSIVREFLYEKFSIEKDDVRDYRGWLFWLLHHRGGLYQIKDADQELWQILVRLPKYFCLKNLLLAIVLSLPRWFIRFPYILYRSFQDMRAQGKGSFSEFRLRVATYAKFISDFQKC